MSAEFADDFDSTSKPDVMKVYMQLRQIAPEVEVIVVGKFYGGRKHGGYGHLNGSAYKLVITRMENVKPLEQKTP